MDTPKPRTPSVVSEEEAALVALIEEHRQEAITQDLTHKALLADPNPEDQDLRHALPLRPEPTTEPQKPKPRNIL